MFLASGCSSVARNGGYGVLHPELMKGGNSGPGGSTVERFSTSKNHPPHHKYESPKQFELKQSWKALRALNAHWTLPVYPVLQDEKTKASDGKSVERKISQKKTDMTNIIATNFV